MVQGERGSGGDGRDLEWRQAVVLGNLERVLEENGESIYGTVETARANSTRAEVGFRKFFRADTRCDTSKRQLLV